MGDPPMREGPLDEYGMSRQLPEGHVDCTAMLPLTVHLGVLSRALPEIDPSHLGVVLEVEPSEYNLELDRSSQWLRMAASLKHVDIDFSEVDGQPYLCGTAMDYQDAQNAVAAGYATELTRLQFTWNAVDRLLRAVPLPSVPAARGRFNSATRLLLETFAADKVPAHYACVLRHLSVHVRNDPHLAHLHTLRRSLDEQPWRGASGLLLAASNQLRNVPAHGDINIPEPASWGQTGERPALPPALHAPRLAVRGLALSVQMLMSALVREHVLIDPEFLMVDERDGEQAEEGDPAPQDARDLLIQLHLS